MLRDIEAANALDMLESKENGMDAGKLDRLLFDVPRVAAAAQGVRHVATLPDPVGEIVRGYNLPNGSAPHPDARARWASSA